MTGTADRNIIELNLAHVAALARVAEKLLDRCSEVLTTIRDAAEEGTEFKDAMVSADLDARSTCFALEYMLDSIAKARRVHA